MVTMATIPRDIIDNLTYQLNTLSEASRMAVRRVVESITYTDLADLREQLITNLDPLFAAATDDAAAFAANLYDEVREYELGQRFGALADSGRDSAATAGAIRALVRFADEGLEILIRQLSERMDYEIKKSAGDCIIANAERDPMKPKFARVPTGAETCMFCIMLASRGFVYTSKKSAGALDHWHPNCDCRVVPGFQGETRIRGYDPDELYDIWKESGFDPNKSGSHNGDHAGTRNRYSKFEYEGKGNRPSFKDFNDVKKYLYDADSQEDLEHRYSMLGSIFGFKSDQMRSISLKNVLKTAQKRIDQKESAG